MNKLCRPKKTALLLAAVILLCGALPALAPLHVAAAPLPVATATAAAALSAGTTERDISSATTEHVANAYVGARDYLDVLFNIDFQDIGASWARDAVYEGGALGIIKGFGSATYGGGTVMTKGQAIALAVRAAGLEAEAQLAGEALEAAERKARAAAAAAAAAANAATPGAAGTGAAGTASSGAAGAGAGANAAATAAAAPDTDAVWINGCLKIAADRGLISADDYKAALGDAAALALSPFRREAAAQRQEFAYWLTRILMVPPVRGQQALFTAYTDWRSVDSLYVPYIEAALRDKILSGDSQGRLNPRDGVTREQAAQMVKNASKYVQAANGFVESSGVVEKITSDIASSLGGSNAGVMRTVFYIRNQLGQLDTITTQLAVSDSAGGASAARRGTGLVVNYGGSLEDEGALRQGDRIRYISSRNRDAGYPAEIRYVELLPGEAARVYLLAQIDGIDAVNRRIAFTQIFPVDFPSAGELRRAAEAPQHLYSLSAEYIYSEGVAVVSEGAHIDVGDLSPGMLVIIGVENYRNLFYIETAGFGRYLDEAGVARGVVEENNPVLGYISLFSESGDRTGVRSFGKEGGRPELMIYNYSDVSALDVRKDGQTSSIDAISPGDSAFVRFDESGELTAVSAVTNYKMRYGIVESVSGGAIIVKYDGEQGVRRSLETGPDVLYFMNYRLVSKSAVTPGSYIRVLYRDLGGAVEACEVTIMSEGDRGLAGSVYKAMLQRFDETSQKAVIYNVQKLVKGAWEKADRKGFDTMPINADTRVYAGGSPVTVAKANKVLRDNEVYIVSKIDYGGVEVASQISVRGADDKEQLYDDVIRSVRRPTGAFGLTQGPSDIAADDQTIVIKDGKLASGAAIEQDDRVYVVASREDATGRMRAEVVEIGDRVGGPKYHIYRGRVTRVSPNKDFTLESFSELDLGGTEWRYANAPKTLGLTFDTLLLTAEGIASIRDFDNRGENNYTDPPRTVYVLCDGTNALAISTAPYGIENVRGRIISLDGLSYDENGELVDGPSGITLNGASFYDRSKAAWAQRKGDMAIALAPNTLIVKNGAPVGPSALKKADAVRVIRSDTSAEGAGYIVIVED